MNRERFVNGLNDAPIILRSSVRILSAEVLNAVIGKLNVLSQWRSLQSCSKK